MTNVFISVMEKIGQDIKVAWEEVVKYLPPAAALASLIFPGQVGTVAAVVNSVDLIQQAVATVEQKFSAAGSPSGTGTQKLGQVLSIVGPSVTQLLASEGLHYNEQQVTNLINAVVAILNVQAAPPSQSVEPAPAAPAA